MATEAPAVLADGAGFEAPDASGTRLITRGAELVLLAEELYLRLFTLALVFLLVSAGLAIWFAAGSTAPLAVTLPFGLAAAAFAFVGLLRPRRTYCWMRYSPARQIAPAVLSALAMVLTGPDSPLWWPALGLVILITSISSLTLSMFAAVLSAAGYVAGTVLGGAAIIRGGQPGILAGAVGFIAYTLVGSFVCDAFARFVLGFGRLERETADSAAPRRVPSFVVGVGGDAGFAEAGRAAGDAGDAGVPGPTADPSRAAISGVDRSPGPLTPRQLEAALLIRDGLNQAETAASLGISRRQVERLLAEARERAGAATTSQLVAMLVQAGLVP